MCPLPRSGLPRPDTRRLQEAAMNEFLALAVIFGLLAWIGAGRDSSSGAGKPKKRYPGRIDA
jgi:hypothetical protein